ncbi:hypothetical protein DFR26_0694 [Paraperlucidibaca baekdonensis]|uniref:Copper(I)-binding protein n=1 Tax=Paraperlucidibaca baekdonensis TaxID=748120 RepID=A0A3E0HA46_9GAMM|nr:copper chaperone PCu(A)C [Paraperlucidibaca baekdonensis]REH40493.1 hypothetical protein DFR26_0694 [Paraperlucidibaca baekdonensis]
MKRIVGVLAGLLSVCATSALAAVHVHDAWIREVPPASRVAALFVALENTGSEAVAIRQMRSAVAERVEWHDMIMNEGHMSMRAREQLLLMPGATVLAPGGSHLMLLGLREPLHIGDQVPVEITLDTGRVLSVNATVRATQPASGHAHDHH